MKKLLVVEFFETFAVVFKQTIFSYKNNRI